MVIFDYSTKTTFCILFYHLKHTFYLIFNLTNHHCSMSDCMVVFKWTDIFQSLNILFLPFSVGEESLNVRNKKITAFRILEKEVRRCTAQKGHHFFVAERIDPLHPVAPPFHFSILLFYHILLYERYTCFASVNCAPSTIRKRATPPPVQTEKAADPSQVSGLSVCAYSAAFSCALWYCRVYSW